eukprot:TRINITY_DN8717_c0_g1_i2.p2 TRINITY_DN8717_c0_g1~~TRINITY_DN8717_c0_g1_i2.p2  ORF type:complete len:200 (+),score=58.31 TRINITY_DN8717_c0_g1_i2:65-664(+)
MCIRDRFTDIKTTFNAMKEAIKESHANEVQSILRGQGDITKRFDDNYSKLLDRLELSETLSKRRLEDLEKTISRFAQEFSENLQELARVNNENSNQIINDFEKALNQTNGEVKIVYKKIGIIEQTMRAQREELGSLINEHEHVASRKNEQFSKAIFDMCRQLNISNPLLLYQNAHSLCLYCVRAWKMPFFVCSLISNKM